MRIGILGGGQLGRMLALAGAPLGHSFLVLCPDPEAPVRGVAEQIVAPYDDAEALERLARACDRITFEIETIPPEILETLAARRPTFPGAESLRRTRDRLDEKRLFRELGIPTPPFLAVHDARSLERAVEEIGLPAVLKTRRFGYDGRGQRVLRHRRDVEGAFTGLGGVPLILEGYVPFDRELSILGVRGQDGATAFYPLTENRHEAGILRLSRAPAQASEALAGEARAHMEKLLQALDHVGVAALELFEREGALLANELAPRVHNSGHWTIEGAEVSQFENHLRAVCGEPLGGTDAIGFSAMINLIGSLPVREEVLATQGAHLHLYQKTPRPGRKVGHVTLHAASLEALEARLAEL